MEKLSRTTTNKMVRQLYRTMQNKPYGSKVYFSQLMDETFHLVKKWQPEELGACEYVYSDFSLYDTEQLSLRRSFLYYARRQNGIVIDSSEMDGMKTGLDPYWKVRHTDELISEFKESAKMHHDSQPNVSCYEITEDDGHYTRRLYTIPSNCGVPKEVLSDSTAICQVISGEAHFTYSNYGYYRSDKNNRLRMLANIKRYDLVRSDVIVVKRSADNEKKNYWMVKNRRKEPLVLYVVYRNQTKQV